MNPIRRPFCAKVLPLVYDDSLSYYETLCKLINTLNGVIEELNTIDTESILELVDERVDKNLETINKQVENLTNTVNNTMTNVNNALELYNQQVKMELADTTANLTTFVNSQLLVLRRYVDSQDTGILSELRYQIELLKNSIPDLTTVYVRSPYSGKLITIQQAIDELWNNLRVYALTADEYDEQRWTASEYDNFKLTAYQYDYYAKEFIYKDPNLYMFSLWTGEITFYQDIIKKLVDLHRTNALTASAYDGKNLTVTAYDGKNATAYNYDWNGKTVLA